MKILNEEILQKQYHSWLNSTHEALEDSKKRPLVYKYFRLLVNSKEKYNMHNVYKYLICSYIVLNICTIIMHYTNVNSLFIPLYLLINICIIYTIYLFVKQQKSLENVYDYVRSHNCNFIVEPSKPIKYYIEVLNYNGDIKDLTFYYDFTKIYWDNDYIAIDCFDSTLYVPDMTTKRNSNN